MKEKPWQVYPEPENPDLQVQLNDPIVFVQIAFESQVFKVELEHSSISIIIILEIPL